MTATTPAQVLLDSSSRYKDTPIYADSDGEVRFALWVPPAEFLSPQIGWQEHRVSQHEVGFLDLIAVQWYGNGYEETGGDAIAEANAIIDPETEMKPGMVLLIPPLSAVQQFQARLGDVES